MSMMTLKMIERTKAGFAAVSSCEAATMPLTSVAWRNGMPGRLGRIGTLVLSILLIVFCARIALGQSGAGSIQGTIADSTGAVIPGATIHVVRTATNVATDTKSNGVGFYQVPELFTGTYTVTVSAPGMKTYTTSVDLLVAQNAVINPVLVPGAESQQITVTGNTIQLTTTDNGTITSTLENARINQLPMNGRSLTTLLSTTTPGLENGGKDINGLMPSAVIYTIDGVTTQDNLRGGLFYGSGNSQLIDPDSVQEVRVETSNSGAQLSTPATVIITTKSGTNSLHGTFFETARNNAFGVAKSRQDAPNFSAPHLVRNEFGLSAGGPIVLPHLYNGKDKSFWFFAYERYSLAQSVSNLTSVPTMAMRQGDFSGLINGAGQLQTLFDPSTTTNSAKCPYTGKANPYCRTPFPNNQIPIGEISPLAKLYYQLVPQPAGPTATANPLVAANLTQVTPELDIEPQLTFRLDHEFNENNRAFLRYTQNLQGTHITSGPQNVAVDGIPAGAAVSQAGYLNNPTNGYFAGLDYTHIFFSSFFAETILSQQWFSEGKYAGAATLTPNVDYESMLGLPNNFGETGFPLLSGQIFQLGSSQTNTARESQIISTIDENLTKTIGHHQLLFGGRFRHERIADLPNEAADTITTGPNPTAIYNTGSGVNYTALANTGNANGSFFLGSAGSYEIWRQGGTAHYHDNELDAYLQDNYRVSRSLTLNFGVRYEAHPAIWTKDGLMTGFDFKNDAEVLTVPVSQLIAEGRTTQSIITNDENIGVNFETPSQAGLPANTLMRNYDLVFLPRFGIAYQPFGSRFGTVLRGGYGLFANPVPIEDFIEYATSYQNPFTVPYTQSYASAAQAIDGLPNELLRYNDPVQFGVMGANTANVINSNSTNGILPGIAQYSVSPDSPPQYITEANFTIEQPLKGNSVLRLSYIYTHAKNLAIGDHYNSALSAYQWEMATGTVPPTGGFSVIGTPLQNTYSTTALRPYNQTTWGDNQALSRTGWSNDNTAEITYQRLFHHGIAYQISYVYSHDLRVGGDNQGTVPPAEYPDADYPGVMGSVGSMTSPYGAVYPGIAPPPRPAGLPDWADYHAMVKFQGYQLDNTNTPIHHVSFNGILDLPFGRGKRFLGNSSRWMNELIGGFQLAGDGNVVSQVFQPSVTNWGAVSPLQVYKHKYPTIDCRSGVCEKSWLWYNGYLAPTVTTGVGGSACTTNCVSGLPASYVPLQTPVDNTPGTTYYGTNDVLVTLANGTQATIAYDAGPQAANYLSKTWINGPFNYTVDLSIFKVFPITQKINLRFNVDAFNALNVQGNNNPDATGLQHVLTSHNLPRELQLTGRLTF